MKNKTVSFYQDVLSALANWYSVLKLNEVLINCNLGKHAKVWNDHLIL